MKLHFTGDIAQLQAGITELSADLGIILANDGIPVSVCQKDGSDLLVSVKNGEASVIYDKKHHFFRALSLLVQHLKSGETEISLCEKPYFTMNGPMFDVSQGNAVIKVSEIKTSSI